MFTKRITCIDGLDVVILPSFVELKTGDKIQVLSRDTKSLVTAMVIALYDNPHGKKIYTVRETKD